tara:strand:- start:592 stop:792 length:201 start_codon:yes stop_codon:yes gene_type:complete
VCTQLAGGFTIAFEIGDEVFAASSPVGKDAANQGSSKALRIPFWRSHSSAAQHFNVINAKTAHLQR